jgi:hypothetical protein
MSPRSHAKQPAAFPRFVICGLHPVRAIRTREGGLDVEVWNFAAGRFERDMSYLDRVLSPLAEDDVVSQSEFEQRIAELDRELRGGRR